MRTIGGYSNYKTIRINSKIISYFAVVLNIIHVNLLIKINSTIENSAILSIAIVTRPMRSFRRQN